MYVPNRSDAQREITSLQERLANVYASTRGATIKEQLIREQESLVSWAEGCGKLLCKDLYREWVGACEAIATGQEHIVYLDPPRNRVVKITKPPGYGVTGESHRYLSFLALSNELFFDDIQIEGVVIIYDEMNEENFAAIIISQPFIYGVRPTEEEIEEWFRQYGFKKIQRHTYFSEAQKIRVEDAHIGNLIKVDGGELIPIDVLPEITG